jgi:hypothetical protein
LPECERAGERSERASEASEKRELALAAGEVRVIRINLVELTIGVQADRKRSVVDTENHIARRSA